MICVPPPGKHISVVICVSLRGKHISLVICVSLRGKHISLVICVLPPGETHISSYMCFRTWETDIANDMYFPVDSRERLFNESVVNDLNYC